MKLTEEIVRLLDENESPPVAHSRTRKDRSPTHRPDVVVRRFS